MGHMSVQIHPVNIEYIGDTLTGACYNLFFHCLLMQILTQKLNRKRALAPERLIGTGINSLKSRANNNE